MGGTVQGAPRPAPLPARAMLGTPVLFLPMIDWSFRVQRPQQLARCFARAGQRVYYPGLRLGAGPPSPQPVESGIWTFALAGDPALDPYRDRLGADGVARALGSLGELAAEHPLDGAWVIAQLPFWRPLAEACREAFRGLLLFDCMDDFSAFEDHADCDAEELALARGADLVTASSRALHAKLAPASRRCAILRNGCDPEHFGPAAARALRRAPAHPILGYFGGIHDWFDAPLVGALASMRPAWEIWLVGDTYRAEVGALRDRANVHFLGEVPYADLPRVASHFDVGIIPFLLNRLTAATDPVKVYEMLAAGLPVVSTDLPELAHLAPHVAVAGTPEDFVARVEEALAAPPEDRAVRRELARSHSWNARFLELTALMSGAEAAAGRPASGVQAVPEPPSSRTLGIGHDRSDLLRQVVRLEACLAGAEDDRAYLARELARVERERHSLEERLQGVTSSRLWRAAEPLRAIRSRLRRSPLPS